MTSPIPRHQQLAERLEQLRSQRTKLVNRASQIAGPLESAKHERSKALIDEVDIAPALRAEIASLTDESASIAQAIELLDKDIAETEPKYHAAQRQFLISNATAAFEAASADAIAARDALSDTTIGFVLGDFRRLMDALHAAHERGRETVKTLQEIANQDPANRTTYTWPVDRFRSVGEANLLTTIDSISQMADFGKART